MTPSELAGLILSGLSIVAVLLKGLQWLIRAENKELKSEVSAIKYETTSNGGKSMNDFIKLQIYPLLQEMRTDQVEIKESVASLNGWKEEHIRDHA